MESTHNYNRAMQVQEGYGNGEQVCENHGFTEVECLTSSCCIWDDNQCWSDIGTNQCVPNNSGTKCYGYITGDGMYTPDIGPYSICDSDAFGDHTYLPNMAYGDLSCCSAEGASSTIWGGNNMFFTGYTYSPRGQCVAFVEMMNQLACHPDQGKFINKDTNTLRICRSGCDAWFDSCGLPGISLPVWLPYTDGTSMCQSLWQGLPSTGCYPAYTNWSQNFACEAQLELLVVEDDCLEAIEPSEELLAYYEFMYEDYGDGSTEYIEYPYGPLCDATDDSTFNFSGTFIYVGIVVGAIAGCTVLAFLFYYFCCSRRDKNSAAINFHNETTPPVHEAAFQLEYPNSNAAGNMNNNTQQEPDVDLQSKSDILSLRNLVPIPVQHHNAEVIQAVLVPVPVPEEPVTELTFIQRLDLREIEEKKKAGFISEEEYNKKKKIILDK